MEKLYFAKYLFASGKINIGDSIAFEGNINDIHIYSEDDVFPLKYSDRKVGLFICSKKINVGDTVRYNEPVNENFKCTQAHIDSSKDNKEIFKIIQEISLDETWADSEPDKDGSFIKTIKDRQEFTEVDIFCLGVDTENL